MEEIVQVMGWDHDSDLIPTHSFMEDQANVPPNETSVRVRETSWTTITLGKSLLLASASSLVKSGIIIALPHEIMWVKCFVKCHVNLSLSMSEKIDQILVMCKALC